MGLINVVSLILGIIALFFSILIIGNKDTYGFRRKRLYSILSLGSAGGAIYFQFIYSYYLVTIEDFSALMDITGASVVVSGSLIILVILLNFFAFTSDKN